MYENIFSDRKKYDKDIDDFYLICFILAKVCVSGWGTQQRGRTISFFLVNLLKIESDIKGHLNNKVIRNLVNPKFSITSYYGAHFVKILIFS